jgi:branched-chain amino acid transport system ATP-binding protein
VDAGWGETHVVSDVSFRLPAGETLAILGRNGVGKSTLLSTIAGRADLRRGNISFAGQSLNKLPAYSRMRLGIGFVPQEREIFPSLSVEENLTVATRPGPDRASEWNLERVYNLFPRLKERRHGRGGQLSGGEQQMLSIGRALMGNPTLLLMDEPLEGLAPVIVDLLVEAMQRIRAETKLTIVLVEQHVDIAIEFSKRIIVLDRGLMVYDGSDGSAPVDRARIEALVGVATMAAE